MRTARQTGFTLAEMLIGLVVTSIVMTAVAAVVIGVQQSYQTDTEVKVVTENGRTALTYLEKSLRLAGYGLDPRLAFEANHQAFPGLNRDNAEVGGFDPGTVVTDDLAYRYREPAFSRPGRLDGAVHLSTPAGVELLRGSLLMIVCSAPDARGLFPTSWQRVDVPFDTPLPATAIEVPVTPAGPPLISDVNPCLQGAIGPMGPQVFLVHENRLRIVNIEDRPWLVRFRSLERSGATSVTYTGARIDHDDDVRTFYIEPLVPDVEHFQVAFGMNPGNNAGLPNLDSVGGANNNSILGDHPNDPQLCELCPQPYDPLTIDPAGSQPTYAITYGDQLRVKNVPANIRAVHIGLSLRTSRGPANRQARVVPEALFNSTLTPPPTTRDGFIRSTFHTVIPVLNMMSRQAFIPALRDHCPGGPADPNCDANYRGG